MYLICNIVSFCSYGLDKYFAIKHQWRISEKMLLLFSAMGGLGAICGIYLFHHKTRKPLFIIVSIIFCILQLLLLNQIYINK